MDEEIQQALLRLAKARDNAYTFLIENPEFIEQLTANERDDFTTWMQQGMDA